jgi:formylglycine-generating enzyme required for sulfatase activity
MGGSTTLVVNEPKATTAVDFAQTEKPKEGVPARLSVGEAPAMAVPTGLAETTPSDVCTNSIGMRFRRIEPGTFQMGEEGWADVSLTERYWLGVYPVTQGEYERVMKKNPAHFKNNPRCPIESVSWVDATEFCNQLSQLEGLPSYYVGESILGGRGYRLPTEAEWEHGCRAGTETKYYFGDDEGQLDEYAWFEKNSDKKTHPVGEKLPNAWGLYDMVGNVEQWCWDWEGSILVGKRENPTGPKTGSCRMYRGASWASGPGECRSSRRFGVSPTVRYKWIGFRVARDWVA